ncbi:uncharacterized protein LOC124437371 [Xenia sp. Carnegie-2017]|uniref:uncharacterized protein LOC124437371 n=1 Tax=Xenia sp. Carnegie-2017 TaxID=2897299 RepID=UPI001F041DD8|nr:uncharacterized protein LOC124437371 [Xenia sp. Carnegie-2017]
MANSMSSALMIISTILKALQIAALAVGSGFVGKFYKEFYDYFPQNVIKVDYFRHYGRYEIYLNAAGLGVVIVFIGLVFACTRLQCKKHGAFGLLLLQVIGAIELVFASTLLYKVLESYQEHQHLLFISMPSWCDFCEKTDQDFQCYQLTIGMICGFSGAGLFLLDALFSFIAYKRS